MPPAPRPRVAAAAPPAWEVGYRKGGGGFYVRSPDADFQFRQLGCVQFVGSLFNDDFERPDGPGDFSIRRARVDWLADSPGGKAQQAVGPAAGELVPLEVELAATALLPAAGAEGNTQARPTVARNPESSEE